MVNSSEHQQLRELLGAYALGHLDERARREVDDHLAGCAGCRGELAELAPVVSALDRLRGDGSGSVPIGERSAPRALRLDPVAGGPGAWRPQPAPGAARARAAVRRRRAAAAVGVAASVGVAFGLGSWWAGPRTDPPVVPVAMHLDAAGLNAAAGLVKHTWGTELQLEATGLASGESYQVTFVTDDGTEVSAGSFLGTGADPLRCSVNAALPIDTAARITITDAGGALVMDATV